MKLLKANLGIFIFCFFISGCVSAKFPLCPKLSKGKPSSVDGISKTLYDICNKRNIKITVLSSTTVELKGSRRNIRWLRNNYFIILCDFNQMSVPDDETTYKACMKKSKEWIKIIQGKNPQTLMNDGTGYCAICCETNP